MSSYLFTVTIGIVPAFNQYFQTNCTIPNTGISYDGTQLTVYTDSPLSDADQATLAAVIAAYVDPSYFLVLDHTSTLTGLSKRCNSATAVPVQSLIFPAFQDGGLVLDALKSVMVCMLPDVSVLSGADSSATTTVTWSVYDNTRNMDICSETMDVSSVVSAWITAANGGATGPVYNYQTMMFCGLIDKSTTYDCIWTFNLSISNPTVAVQMNGVQMLYYNELTA